MVSIYTYKTMPINTLDKLIEHLTIQSENLATYGAAIGATPAEILAVNTALANLIYLRDYWLLVEENKKVVTAIKQAAFNGVPGEPVAGFPVFPAGVAPSAVTSGYLTEALERDRRWKAAAGYTEEIGIALDLSNSTPPPDPGTVKPTIDISPAQTGYLFSVVVSNRGDSDMWEVQTLAKGAASWVTSASATGKSVDVTMPPSLANDPLQFQVRVQLKKNNANYGLLSDVVYVTVNP